MKTQSNLFGAVYFNRRATSQVAWSYAPPKAARGGVPKAFKASWNSSEELYRRKEVVNIS